MKRAFLIFLAGLILSSAQLYAGNGDFSVNGKLGVGTTSPQGNFHISSSLAGPVQQYFSAQGANSWRFIFPDSVNTGGYGAGAKNFGIYRDGASNYNAIFDQNGNTYFTGG